MTTDEPTTIEQQSFLVADCGHTNTTVALFDVVENSYRLIARATVPTTAGAPYFDVADGVRLAIEKITRITGRQLMYDHGVLISPERTDGTGVDKFTAVISAAAPLDTLLVGLFEDVSLASARRAMRGTYIHETQHFSLADNLSEQEHIMALLQNPSELIFLVGGTDNGSNKRLLRLIEAIDIGLEIIDEARRPPILYAGNQALQEQVETLLGDNNPIQVTANVRPSLESEQTAEAAQIMNSLYRDIKINKMPGIRALNEWGRQVPMPTAQAFATSIRYLAKRQEGRVLGVDLGSDTLSVVMADEQAVQTSIRTDLGIGRPIANLLHHVDASAVAQWLSFDLETADIKDFLVNKSLFPQTIPATEQELHLEHAIVRELLHCAVTEAMNDWRWSTVPPLKMLVARGSTLANVPRPGQAALMLLDAIQPSGVFSLALDRYGLLPGLGAVAAQNPLLSIQAFASGIITHLGHVIAPLGQATPGRKIMTVVVESEQVRRLENEVSFGTLDVISLDPGQMVKVTVQPRRGFDIGLGPGKGTTMTVPMGRVGLIIDARERPLRLPTDDEARRTLIRQWLWDLGG